MGPNEGGWWGDVSLLAACEIPWVRQNRTECPCLVWVHLAVGTDG